MAMVQFHHDWVPSDDEQAFRRVLCADRRILMVIGRDIERRCRVMSARVHGDYEMAHHNMGHHVCLAAGAVREQSDLEMVADLVRVPADTRALLLEPRRHIDLGVDLASTRPRGVLGCQRCAGFGTVRTSFVDMDGFPVEGPCETCDGSGLAIDWILVRGGAEPLHPAWVRTIRDQASAAGVPFCFLGWGDWLPWEAVFASEDDRGRAMFAAFEHGRFGGSLFSQAGRERSGRLLDGREHLDSPWGPLEVTT